MLLRERAEIELGRTVYNESPDVLADLLAEHDCWPEALAIARHNPGWGQKWIPQQLAKAGNDGQLRKLCDQGNEYAGREYVWLLARTQRMREALRLARTFANDGHMWAAVVLATCLAESGRFDELIARAASGDKHASRQLVVSAGTGQLTDGEALLRHGLTATGSRQPSP